MSTRTTRNTIQTLAKSLLNKLENRKFIEFNPRQRGELQQALAGELSKLVLSDEDLVDRVRTELAGKADAVADANLTETEAFQSRKKALKDKVGEHELGGLFYQKPVRDVVAKVGKFLMDTTLVEEVFESDEAIHKLLLDAMQTFDESKIS